MWAYLANPSIAWDACFWQRPLPPGFKLCLRRPYKRLQSDGCNVRTCPQSMDRRCVISVNVNETTTDKAAASDIEPAYDQRPHRSLRRQSTWQLTTTASPSPRQFCRGRLLFFVAVRLSVEDPVLSFVMSVDLHHVRAVCSSHRRDD